MITTIIPMKRNTNANDTTTFTAGKPLAAKIFV